MTEIPDRPFDKIAINLVTNCKTSTLNNKHILTIIDHLTGWPEAFPIPDKSADMIVATFFNEYLTVHMRLLLYFVQQWHRIQEQPHGPSPATAWD